MSARRRPLPSATRLARKALERAALRRSVLAADASFEPDPGARVRAWAALVARLFRGE
jgi:hypothetical protein